MPETIDAPLPSKELIWRVTDTEDAEWFHTSGRRSLEDLRCAVGVARRDLESFRRVLDFGCGAGRMLRWAGELAETIEVHGVDIDADAIAWCRENLPFARCEVGPWEPPLPYPDAHFDLVHGHSVFTHLPEHYQDLWLGELERITQPGGLLVLSIHGEHVFEVVGGSFPTDHSWRKTLRHHGFLYVEEDGWQGGPFPDFYHSTFHTPWYVFAHWSRWFRILAYLPRHNLDFHDTVVLQRYQPDEPRVVTLPPALEPMEATESGEPAPAPAFDDGLDELLARAHELAAQPDPSVRRGPLRSRLRAILRPGSCHRQRALDDHLLGIVERLARRR